jgi:hypothetical protein
MPEITLGHALGDDVTEALADQFEPDQSAGDHEWDGHGACFVYIFEHDTAVPHYTDELAYDLTIGAGVYLRRVTGKTECSWQVLAGDVDAYMTDLEARWRAETDGTRKASCDECGAEQGEACRVPGCQGDWT